MSRLEISIKRADIDAFRQILAENPRLASIVITQVEHDLKDVKPELEKLREIFAESIKLFKQRFDVNRSAVAEEFRQLLMLMYIDGVADNRPRIARIQLESCDAERIFPIISGFIRELESLVQAEPDGYVDHTKKFLWRSLNVDPLEALHLLVTQGLDIGVKRSVVTVFKEKGLDVGYAPLYPHNMTLPPYRQMLDRIVYRELSIHETRM